MGPSQRLFVMMVGAALAVSGCSKPTADALLGRINKAHEDYDLEKFYASSREFLDHYPEHAERDRVRYAMAEQMVATNLSHPNSALAVEARRHLRDATEEARTKSDRFDAALLLMKFTPNVDVQREARAMIETYGDHRGVQQVYFWAITALAEQQKLQAAADLAEKLLERFPEMPNRAPYEAIVRRNALVGAPAPLGPAVTASIGDALDGKVVLVDFWATWCGPCVSALPKIVAYHEKNADRGFEVLQISLDEDEAAYREFLAAHTHVGVQLRTTGDDGIDEAFGVRVLPAYFILDQEGRVRRSDVPYGELFSAIDRELDRHKKEAPSPR